MSKVKLLCRTPLTMSPLKLLPRCASWTIRAVMSFSRKILRTASALAFSALTPAPADAHPHTFIQVEAAILIDSGEVQGLRYVWRFDRAYLDGLREEYDTNRDGLLSDEELLSWLTASKRNLETFKFFTTVRQGSQVMPLGTADSHRVERAADGLALHFTVRLANPIATKAGPVRIDIFDRTFFTEFVLGDGHGVTIDGAAACSATVALAPGGEQQRAITAFMKIFGRADAKLSPAKDITVTCKD